MLATEGALSSPGLRVLLGVEGVHGNSYGLLRLQSQSPLERNELKVRHFGLKREKHPSKFG